MLIVFPLFFVKINDKTILYKTINVNIPNEVDDNGFIKIKLNIGTDKWKMYSTCNNYLYRVMETKYEQ